MKLTSWLKSGSAVRMIAASLVVAFAQFALFADGVTRSVRPLAEGCRVTLTWNFAGEVESDLVLEEQLGDGWQVEDSTVPFDSLDASSLNGGVARFAVKAALLSGRGSISFIARSGGAETGTVRGSWKLYLSGSRRGGAIDGQSALSLNPNGVDGDADSGELEGEGEAVAISSFKVAANGSRVVGYAGAASAGTLVVEGCAGLGSEWKEIKRAVISAGDGTIVLSSEEAGECRFLRLKLFK